MPLENPRESGNFLTIKRTEAYNCGIGHIVYAGDPGMTPLDLSADVSFEEGAVYGAFQHERAVLDYGDWKSEYAELTDGVGLVDFRQRTRLELTGNDRAAFLNHLCTHDVVGLTPGAGRETFLTDSTAHVLAHLQVFARPDSLVLETVAGQSEQIVAHLDYYRIREDVAFHDRTAQWCEFLLAGPESEELLRRLTSNRPPAKRLDGVTIHLAGHAVDLRRVDLAGPNGFLLTFHAEAARVLWRMLREAGARPCGQLAAEAVRIEAGWPAYGRDVTKANLAQEVARDDSAISFTKGCYLGQETIARVDSRGRVNKTLIGLKFRGTEVPPCECELSVTEKMVGRVTSATFSPRLGSALALGYVHHPHNHPGARLTSAAGPVEVISLPL